jgi:hypothetical protein
VVTVSLGVLRNLVGFRGMAERLATADGLKHALDLTAGNTEWLPTFESIVEIFSEAARCLGHYHQGAQAVEGRQDPATVVDATALIDTLVDCAARLPSEMALTRLSILCHVIKVLPEPGVCTVYLSRFQE